jgi:hypothetical protein
MNADRLERVSIRLRHDGLTSLSMARRAWLDSAARCAWRWFLSTGRVGTIERREAMVAADPR